MGQNRLLHKHQISSLVPSAKMIKIHTCGQLPSIDGSVSVTVKLIKESLPLRKVVPQALKFVQFNCTTLISVKHTYECTQPNYSLQNDISIENKDATSEFVPYSIIECELTG